MASSGIRRKVDDLGRVVIPAGMRRTLGIREGDTIEVAVEGERVVLAKPRDACVFCGREEDELTGFRGRLVCRDCLASLGSVDERRRATEVARPPREEPAGTAADLPSWEARPRGGRAGGHGGPPPTGGRPATRPGTGVPAARSDEDVPAARPGTGVPPARSDEGISAPPAGPGAEDDPTFRPGPGEDDDPVPAPRKNPTEEEPPAERPRRRPPYDPASTTAW